MIVELIRKEFVKGRSNIHSRKITKFLKLLLKLILLGAFIALECFIFVSLDKKISQYSTYGTFDFLVFFLFIMFVIGLFSAALNGRKVIFSKDDRNILIPLPLTNETVVLAKIIYIYLKNALLTLVLTTPLLISFGAIRGQIPYYFIFSCLYPFIMAVAQIAVGLLFIALIEIIYKFIKKHDFIQLLLASILVIGLCYAYKFVLEMFLDALNDSSVGGVFSPEFVNFLHQNTKFMIPVINILDPLINSFNIVSNISTFVGASILTLVVSFFVVTYFYNLFNRRQVDVRSSHGTHKNIKLVTPFKALLKKEMDLLFKDSGLTFSYTALLIMCPFLSFSVISALETIVYENLTFYTVYFPEIVNGLNITLILLFASIINSSAALSISREGKALQIVKYIPVHAYKQVLAKIIIPMMLSIISLIITEVVLITTGAISFVAFITSMVIGIIIIVAMNILGVIFDMHDKTPSKHKLSYLVRLISLGYPAVLFVIHFFLSLIKFEGIWLYVIEIGITVIFIALCFINIRKRFVKAFRRMEAK